jgi:hypothetical protein
VERHINNSVEEKGIGKHMMKKFSLFAAALFIISLACCEITFNEPADIRILNSSSSTIYYVSIVRNTQSDDFHDRVITPGAACTFSVSGGNYYNVGVMANSTEYYLYNLYVSSGETLVVEFYGMGLNYYLL